MAVNMIARGSYSLQIADAKKFYLKFAGATASSLTADDISADMRSPINQKIKTVIAQIVSGLDREIVGISSRLEEIAEMMREPMEAAFDEYGVRIVNFYVEALEIVEDESYLILKEARAQAAAKMVHARGSLSEVTILGDDYGRVKTAEIMMSAANNPHSGVVGEGLGLGAGIAMGGVMGSAANGLLSPLGNPRPSAPSAAPVPEQDANTIVAPCGHRVSPGAKFCPECGASVKITCPECGTEVGPSSKFCPECGKGLR